MDLTITQPAFLWIFGIFGVLGLMFMVVLIVIFIQIARLMKFANEKATQVAGTIDEVRATIHNATETVNDTRDRIANFVAFTTSAAGVAKLVGSIRDNWGGHHKRDDLFDDDVTKHGK